MVPIIVPDNEINNDPNNKVSLSYCYYSDYENDETVPSIPMTKKHKMMDSSLTFDLDLLPRAPKTPKTFHNNINEDIVWSSCNTTPKSTKQMVYIFDDFIPSAPQFPLLDMNDEADSVVDISSLLAPRFSILNNDCIEQAPRLPYLDDDDDWINGFYNNHDKENRPPSLTLLPRFAKQVLT